MVSTTLATIVATSQESNSVHRQHIQEYSNTHSARPYYLTESVSVAFIGAKYLKHTDRIYNNVNLPPLSASLNDVGHQIIPPVRQQLSENNLPKNKPSKSLSPAKSLLSDKISILFPKCRPKTEVTLNNISTKVNNTTYIQQFKSSRVSSLDSSESSSTLTPGITVHPYMCSDPIAEKNQQDHSTTNSDVSATNMPRKQNTLSPLKNSFKKETYSDATHNDTSASTVLNSPDFTENGSKGNFFQKQHVKVGRSPMSHPEALFPISMDTPIRGSTFLADGQVIIFENNVESWQNLRVTTDNNNEKPIQQITNQQSRSNETMEISLQHGEKIEQKWEYLDGSITISAGRQHGIKDCDLSPCTNGEDSHKGNHQSLQLHFHRPLFSNKSPQFHMARPGFPQRMHATQAETSTYVKNDVKHLNTDDTSNDVSEIGTLSSLTPLENPSFDYLYEFSETRKVLEEFFKCPSNEVKPIENNSDVESLDMQNAFGTHAENGSNIYVEQRFRSSSTPNHQNETGGNDDTGYFDLTDNKEIHSIDFFLDSTSRSSGDIVEQHDRVNLNQKPQKTLRYSPETTDYDSNCGDLDSLSGEYNTVSPFSNYVRCYTSMPILEDGLSSGHASDTENNNASAGISILMEAKKVPDAQFARESLDSSDYLLMKPKSPNNINGKEQSRQKPELKNATNNDKVFKNIDPDLDSLYSISVFHRPDIVQLTPPPPAPAAHRKTNDSTCTDPQNLEVTEVELKHSNSTHTLIQTKRATAAKDLSSPLNLSLNAQRSLTTPTLTSSSTALQEQIASPIWIPRQLESSKNSCNDSTDCCNKNLSADEEDIDTDLETDRLLGHQRLDDKGFYDAGRSWERRPRSLFVSSLSKFSPNVQLTDKKTTSSVLRQGFNSSLPMTAEIVPLEVVDISNEHLLDSSETMPIVDLMENSKENAYESNNYTADSPDGSTKSKKDSEKKAKKCKNKEVLIEGVLFRAQYLGSTQLVCEGQPTKSTRMMQAEEAVSRIKALAPDGEKQPSTEVDLFISTEKIMVLNTDLKEIMMDHALRTISYIADIGELVVLMARRRFIPHDIDDAPKANRTPKMICHVFESEEAQFIAQSIGQAFQVAYMEFLKANGIEDQSFVKEMDYQEVLNSQEIFGDELEIFAKKELQKEVVVPKAKGEILGVVIVESGWGSMLPTVVIANLMSTGAAARCGQLNIGDQLIAINGVSLVGLPLSTCQNLIKNSKNQTVVKFTVVPCAPVVEVKIKRPNTKYQLGFSVQNGVICSLLRGGIAERGGVRVGHRIIEINNQSVVAVPHEKIVNLLATSIGEILMKTMPTSMFRLLTGQENPIYI